MAGALDAQGDFAAIGDKDLFEHRLSRGSSLHADACQGALLRLAWGKNAAIGDKDLFEHRLSRGSSLHADACQGALLRLACGKNAAIGDKDLFKHEIPGSLQVCGGAARLTR
ncbi:hypothetical protein [Paracidovorax avenae]|uniref:hypothetical protein n=1 Tax=Paracidovorax avenae TaxID=80867 RepID=UPI001260235D|nr:hypothetical protein [Paracidovorax avenae]